MTEPGKPKRDWRVSVILLTIWAIALLIVLQGNNEIPLSMIGIATLFFIILIPAMNDLVSAIEKQISGSSGGTPKDRET